MKYVKTFENFSTEMDSMAQVDKPELDPNSPEYKAMLMRLADEKGLDKQEVVEVDKMMKKEETASNESLEGSYAFADSLLPIIGILVGGISTIVGMAFGHVALKRRRGLKNYVKYMADKKVKEMIKKDPNILDKNSVEDLISQAYDEMMDDKEFIENAKNTENLSRWADGPGYGGGMQGLPGMGGF